MERSSAVGYKEKDPDVQTVCKLAEDVREAVMEYQVGFDLVITLRMYS